MDKNGVFESVKNIIAESLETSENIALNTKFNELSEWSSIIYIMVISAIEEKYDITLPPEELFDVEDVNGLVDLTLRSL